MQITMVASEFAPLAKTGGLADVVYGLARELASRGHDLEVILPRYDTLLSEDVPAPESYLSDLQVPFHDESIRCDVHLVETGGVRCFLIDPDSSRRLFARGTLYGERDDPERFAFFSLAALEFMFQTGRRPDVVHCHDWQTGLVPVLLFELYEQLGMTHPRVCYTLHNVRHQGVTGEAVLRQVGLDPRRVMTPDRLLDHSYPDAVNLMKGGIVYANFVTTVSPRYASEIQHTELGCGLQPVLEGHASKFRGVLNGLDYEDWNPATDLRIAAPYSAENLDAKDANRDALRASLGLEDAAKPVVAMVTRLDRQKGVDLIEHAIDFSLAAQAQVVLLGAATEPQLHKRFVEIRDRLADNSDCRIELRHDERLAHQIYAGADMVVLPSAYEPCGLTQIIALRYGAVPIVRATGGLADTVFDANYSERDFFARNGYTFSDFSPAGLESAMRRAISLWYTHPDYYRQLQLNGMAYDYSWTEPGGHYLDIYRHIVQA